MSRLSKEREGAIRGSVQMWTEKELLDELDAVRAERDALLKSAKLEHTPCRRSPCVMCVAIQAAERKEKP